MQFDDQEKTFIFIDDRNKIISFCKKESKYLKIKTSEICCELYYRYSDDRDVDYERLKKYVEKRIETR